MIYLILFLIIFAPNSYAGTQRFSADALEWWLRNQAKFIGANVDTKKMPNGDWEITRWEANGVVRPTDPEVENIINQYETHLISKKNQDDADVDAILVKLKISKNEFKKLEENI